MRELLVLTTALFITACSATVPPPPVSSPAPTVAAPAPVPRPASAVPQAAAPVPVPRPASAKVEPFDLNKLGGATESTVIAMIG